MATIATMATIASFFGDYGENIGDYLATMPDIADLLPWVRGFNPICSVPGDLFSGYGEHWHEKSRLEYGDNSTKLYFKF